MSCYMEEREKLLGKGITIAIIDSGANCKHPLLKDAQIDVISIDSENDVNGSSVDAGGGASDLLGHGTAVCGILKGIVPKARLIMVRAFNDRMEANLSQVMCALEKIYESIECDIVHLSLGLTMCDNVEGLRDLCSKLTQKGAVIVSAYDNAGAMSYPACFDNVIGVDFSSISRSTREYEYVTNSGINIKAYGALQRVLWTNPEYMLVKGTSFAAAHVSGMVAQIMEQGIRDFSGILEELRKGAVKTHEFGMMQPCDPMPEIRKAILFPFSKEIHSIVRFQDMLPFMLDGVYDIKQMAQIGKNVSALMETTLDRDHVIQNVDKIDWEGEFDTVIMGHTREMSWRTRKDLAKWFIEQCGIYNKHLYSFDDLSAYEELVRLNRQKGLCVVWPRIGKEHLPKGRFGKLWRSSTPIVGVFGTSAKQGKFTLQLLLRKMLMEKGYSVAQLGTEPSSLLFGFDEVFPFGYDSTVDISGHQSVAMLNEMIHRIECKNPDIILVGCQSGTVPYDMGNLLRVPLPQIEFIMGTMPDAVVLCVNPHDEMEYIKRTVYFIESAANCKVVAIVVFPMEYQSFMAGFSYKRVAVNTEKMKSVIYGIQSNTGIPAFRLADSDDLHRLCEELLNYFA